MEIPFVDLSLQYEVIKDELDAELQRVFNDCSFISGVTVEELEQKFRDYLGVRHVVGVGNGTDAITIALRALGIDPGDGVITAANTFIATVEGIVHAGATPVLVDVCPDTYTLDPEQLEAAITSRTRAIILVHLYGQTADMAPIREIAERHGLDVLEDAAQAHGALYKGHKAGSMGHAACFSFYPAKNLGAYGDAGAVVTDDDQIALTVRKLRDHGGVEKYQHDLVGYNSRLDTLQAAVLNVKLEYLDQWNEARRQNARLYDELLSGIPGIVTPIVREGATHVYHLYVIRVEDGWRDELKAHLESRGIGTGIHYPTPIHLTNAFRYLGYQPGDFPVTEEYTSQILSLPMYPELTREQIEYVVSKIEEYMRVHA